MLFFLISVIDLVIAADLSNETPPTPAPALSLNEHYTEFTNKLQELGFNDTCFAAARNTINNCSQDTVQAQHSSLIQLVSLFANKTESRPRHCKDLLESGDSGSGLRLVYPYPGQAERRVTVYCDHTVDGGGWTVFQRRNRNSSRQDFQRSWTEYEIGFGDIDGEFWLGLDHLHILTSTTMQQLRVDLADYEGGKAWAKYQFFNVGPSESKYLLQVARYSGNAGDSLADHNGQRFTTHDQDNDSHSSRNCAKIYRGAWWYNKCHRSNLNGYQHEGSNSPHAEGINWYEWKGHDYSLRSTTMMIRPTF